MKLLRKHGPWFTALSALILIAVPIIIRAFSGSPLLHSPETYKNLILTEKFSHDPIGMFSEGFTSDKILPYSISFLSVAFPLQNLVYVSAILSLASAFFLYKALKRFGMKKELTILTTLIYVFSPLYSHIATSLTFYSASIFLITVSLYLYSRFESSYALIPAVPTSIFSPELFIALFLALLVFLYYFKKDWKSPLIMGIAGAVLIVAFCVFLDFTPQFAPTGSIDFGSYVSDMGSTFGYTFFSFLLSLIAVLTLWNRKPYLVPSFVFLVLLVFSALFPPARLVVNIAVSAFAAYSIYFLASREWALEDLKDVSLLIIALSLLFSAVSYNNRIVDMSPTDSTLDVLDDIRYTDREGKVFSARENGYVIEYYTGRETFWNLESEGWGREAALYRDALASSSPTITKQIFDEEGITYVYLEPTMRDARGLSTVLRLSENFIKLSEVEEKSSWLYIRNRGGQ